MPQAKKKKKGNPASGEFGRLLRSHRKRLGISINQLARAVPIDDGLISKIERGLRPPPMIVPYVHRIIAVLGFAPDSPEATKLLGAAKKENLSKSGQGRRQILLLAPGPDGKIPMFYPLGVASPGFSGLDTTIEAIEEIKLAGATGQRFPPPIVDLSDDKAAMPTADIMDQVGANAAPPLIELPDGLAQALAKIGLGGIQHVISKTGIQITEFSDEAASFQFGFDLQSSDEKRYRIGISITSLPGEAVKKN